MQKQQSRRPRLNNQIREPQVRVIDFDGKQLGTMTVQEALKIANERGFDLVEVGPFVRPPIAKIMDYGKYIYQKEKKERHAGSAKSPAHEVKTVKIGFKTEIHDLAIRAGQVDKFLQRGHRVRIELTLRGREKSMAEMGRAKLESFSKLIAESYVAEDPIRRSPAGLGMLIRPEKKK